MPPMIATVPWRGKPQQSCSAPVLSVPFPPHLQLSLDSGAAEGTMMEEVSMVVAYDAHVFGQLSNEDFLASLVAGSKPKAVVGVPPLPVMLCPGVKSFCWKLCFFVL